jgi:hypothetical protein
MVKNSLLKPPFVGLIYLFVFLGSFILKARKISRGGWKTNQAKDNTNMK